MNDKIKQSNHKRMVERPIYKFIIGFIGGFCAVIFPRLMASLALSDSNIVLLSTAYIALAILFAILIGSVVMIMEWGVLKEPRATFMTALGLPAILAGALNTSNGAYVLDNKEKENSELTELVQTLSEIPKYSTDHFTPLSDTANTIYRISPLAMIGISDVFAQDQVAEAQASFDFNPSMKVQQKKYYIILQQADNESDAKQKTESIKSVVPNAQAVVSGNEYLVIDPVPKAKSAALLEAIELKEQGLNPGLLEQR